MPEFRMRQVKNACLPRSSWVLVLSAIHATASLAKDLRLEEIGFDLAVQVDLEDAWRRVERAAMRAQEDVRAARQAAVRVRWDRMTPEERREATRAATAASPRTKPGRRMQP